MTGTPSEPYPPYDIWFAQQQLEDGSWITYPPIRDRNKALERTRRNRADCPGRKHRLIRETTRYAIDEEN